MVNMDMKVKAATAEALDVPNPNNEPELTISLIPEHTVRRVLQRMITHPLMDHEDRQFAVLMVAYELNIKLNKGE